MKTSISRGIGQAGCVRQVRGCLPRSAINTSTTTHLAFVAAPVDRRAENLCRGSQITDTASVDSTVNDVVAPEVVKAPAPPANGTALIKVCRLLSS